MAILKFCECLNTSVLSDIQDIGRTSAPAVQPGGGIDYLELVLPHSVRFTPEFEASRRNARVRLNSEDLRLAGWPLIIKHPAVRRKNATTLRTLRIDKVNRKDGSTILQWLTEALLNVDALTLPVRRVDFAVDLVGGPTVEHFRQTTRVRLKRKGREYVTQSPSRGEFSKLCHEWGRVQTISFGDVKSDCLKIYDKAAQSRETAPQFREDLPRDWVRVERLLIGGKIPPQIRTLGSLLANATAFDPFFDVEIAVRAEITPACIVSSMHLSESQKMNALYVWALIREFGRSEAVKRVRSKHKRKATRMFDWFDSAKGTSSFAMPSRESLAAACQRACRNQLDRQSCAEISTPLLYNNTFSGCNMYQTQSL